MAALALPPDVQAAREAAIVRLDALAADMRGLAGRLMSASSGANFAAGPLAEAARKGWTFAQCALLHAEAKLPCERMLAAIADTPQAIASPGLVQLSYSTLQAAKARLHGRPPAPAALLCEASR
ncbi:hypothetical protein [Bosea sp. (in: a-proteobacteria)]|uniref:hypothetical protein n=1 Tax=Bosea sp. (in: a-proteobacteria) TaxID=1871050 RepID=UPI0025C45EFD|nr:hypothetical protein [Bosea sp. (in: a-proteobacteria)]MBR3190856.1 hypothetical protein [Bosea sp. (in: a-proteobacteria)]